jgi:hypothetical protein
MKHSPVQTAVTMRMRAFDADRWHTISLEPRGCDCEEFETARNCAHLKALRGAASRSRITVIPSTRARQAVYSAYRLRRMCDGIGAFEVASVCSGTMALIPN